MPPGTWTRADPARRFFTFLLLFMGAMLGVVLADNLILLVLAWELTSLSSFLLIGYWHARADARQGARMALTITGAGGLCLLGGVLLIGHIVGSFKLDVVLASGDLIRAHPLYTAAGAGAAGRLHQERAVPVSLLAAACDGRAHAGVGLPALGHDGQVRRLPAGTPVPGAGWQRALVLDRQQRGRRDAAGGRLRGHLPARPEGPAGLQHHQPPGPDHAAASA
jgi:hypothetical protein